VVTANQLCGQRQQRRVGVAEAARQQQRQRRRRNLQCDHQQCEYDNEDGDQRTDDLGEVAAAAAGIIAEHRH